MSASNHTDISHLTKKKHDIFDVSSWGHHESEPSAPPKERDSHIEIHEAVEFQPDADVEDYVEQTASDISLSEDLKNLGVQSTHVVQYPHFQEVEVPLSDEKIVAGLKRPMNSALRWLAETCRYLLRKAHIRLKIAHGKAQRVFEK